MAQAPQPSDNGYLSNVEGGKIFFWSGWKQFSM
jgi:hypothetical protein